MRKDERILTYEYVEQDGGQMAHEEKILELMQKLVIADTKTLAEIMSALEFWKAGTSAYQNTYKSATTLTALGKLEKGGDHWKLPGTRSEYKDHAKHLTSCLSIILKLVSAHIYREHWIDQIRLRPDALILLMREGKGLSVILEVADTEPQSSLVNKLNVWRNWEHSLDYLSDLFKVKIPGFQFVIAGEPIDGAMTFNQLLQEITNEDSGIKKL